MHVPHLKLLPATLRAVVQEFVTRDGTDHSSVERRIASVLQQLDAGRVELHFDDDSGTCNIVAVEGGKTLPAADANDHRSPDLQAGPW